VFVSCLRASFVVLVASACTPTAAAPAPEPEVETVTPVPVQALASDRDQWTDRDRRGRGPRSREEWGDPVTGDPLFRCDSDEDCAIVRMDCCDECNGGWELAVNVAEVENVETKYSARDCSSRLCTKKGCFAKPTASCQIGECVRRIAPRHASSEQQPRYERNRVPPTVLDMLAR
jgi:hypothetical protein